MKMQKTKQEEASIIDLTIYDYDFHRI